MKYAVVDDEIVNTIVYYETISLILASRFETNIEHAFDELETNPENYFNLDDKKHRRIIIKGFPYAFIYCIEGASVLIKMLFPLLENPTKLLIGLR